MTSRDSNYDGAPWTSNLQSSVDKCECVYVLYTNTKGGDQMVAPKIKAKGKKRKEEKS